MKYNKWILPCISVVFCVFFYFWLETTPNDSPMIFIAPIVKGVEIFTSHRFTHRIGEGFYTYVLNKTPIIINKTCSGGVFFAICFSLLSLTQIPRFSKNRQRLACFCGLLVASYVIAIVCSIFRIIPSMVFIGIDAVTRPVLIHNVIGIITFIVFISLSYLGIQAAVSKILKHTNQKEV